MMSRNPKGEKAGLYTGTMTWTMIWIRNSRFHDAAGL
jgi:hypothetical protein